MRIIVSVSIQTDDESPAVAGDVFTCERTSLAPDTVGLRLDEAKDLLAGVQEQMVGEQARAAVAGQATCPSCGAARRHKDTRQIVVRTLYGVLRLESPRWWHCHCTAHEHATISPLAALLPERATPELLYLEAKFAALASYGTSANLLGELLPLGRRLHAAAVRFHAQAVAQRLEDELGEEQAGFIDTCQADREALPRPDLPLVVGLDGGYVRSATQRSRRDGWFEVIAGKVVPADGKPTCFGYVQTYDTTPKRRLYEALRAHGIQDNQQVTFLTDGGEDIRDLPLYLNPQSEHLLDWFHITMRITVMANMAKSLRPPPPAADPDLELPADSADRIPNYGERRRAGEAISTAFVESAVNQVISKRMVKKQQMRWTPRGAHLLLQVRTRVLNEQLADDFHRWHPGFTHRPPGLEEPTAA